MTKWKTFHCATCGIEQVKIGPHHKYCRPCSMARAEARKVAYREKTRFDPVHRTRRNRQQVELNKKLRADFYPAAGQQRSIRRSIFDPFSPPDLQWACRITLPFNRASSKNNIYGVNGFHVFKRQECRAFQAEVERAARDSLRDRKAVQNKVWIAIHVEKPNHRFDAINVIDAIADGLKIALGVDDRWFCIRQVDWSINKTNPKFIIEFGQDTHDPAQVCSICGQIQPFSEYSKHSTAKNGIHRVCHSCTRLAKQLKKEQQLRAKGGGDTAQTLIEVSPVWDA